MIQLFKPQLPVKVDEILTALEGDLVRNTSDADLYDALTPLIIHAYNVSGHNLPEGQEFTYFVTTVQRDIQDICRTFPVRLNELPIAFNRGVRKEYGEYVGLPVIRFGEFLKKYISSIERVEALANKHTAIEAPKEPTEQEKFEIGKNNALRAYKDVKEGKDITLYGRVVYDFLDGLGMIELSTAEKKQFFNEAKDQIIRENHVKVTGSVDMALIRRVKTLLESIESGGEKELIINRSKALAVRSVLEGMIFEDVELELNYESK